MIYKMLLASQQKCDPLTNEATTHTHLLLMGMHERDGQMHANQGQDCKYFVHMIPFHHQSAL